MRHATSPVSTIVRRKVAHGLPRRPHAARCGNLLDGAPIRHVAPSERSQREAAEVLQRRLPAERSHRADHRLGAADRLTEDCAALLGAMSGPR